MPVSCCAVNCTNRFSKNSGIGFFVFPADEARKKLWCRAISHDKWIPKKFDRICGEHFARGRPSKNPEDVDFVPTIFKDRKRRIIGPKIDDTRGKHLVKRTRRKQDQDEVETAAKILINLSSTSFEDSTVSNPTYTDAEVQTDPTPESVEFRRQVQLKVTIQQLQSKLLSLEGTLFTLSQKQKMMTFIVDNNEKTRFLTGLPSYALFCSLFDYMQPVIERARKTSADLEVSMPGRPRKLTCKEEFLAVLIRLRLGLLVEDISARFEVSPATFSRFFSLWIKTLAAEMKNIFPWPTKEQIKSKTPEVFKKYPNTRVIIDCTEFFIQRPTSLVAQALTFSHYKHHNTFKVLIGISPGGVITFVSRLWGGRISDIAITEKSGLLDLLEPGDNVMADRGFNIGEVLENRGITLNIPPFLGQRSQLSVKQVLETRRIASLRIHVERAIGRLKNYRLCQSTFPLSLADLASDIVFVCAYLTNFLKPIVPPDI